MKITGHAALNAYLGCCKHTTKRLILYSDFPKANLQRVGNSLVHTWEKERVDAWLATNKLPTCRPGSIYEKGLASSLPKHESDTAGVKQTLPGG